MFLCIFFLYFLINMLSTLRFPFISEFDEIDDLLTKLYYLYQKSPKRYRELKTFSEIFGNSIAKPAKAYGTRWINHKLKAMETFVANYGAYMLHLESLSQTDSVPAKREELKGWLSKWTHAKYPMLITVYIDILTPLKVRIILNFWYDSLSSF